MVAFSREATFTPPTRTPLQLHLIGIDFCWAHPLQEALLTCAWWPHDFLHQNGHFLPNDETPISLLTPWKFNSSQLRICPSKRKVVVFQASFFRVELLDFGGEESWSHTYEDPTKTPGDVQSAGGMVNRTRNKTNINMVQNSPHLAWNLIIRFYRSY